MKGRVEEGGTGVMGGRDEVYLRFSKREDVSVHTCKFKPRKGHLYIK